jgi:hypothetical protein
MNVPWRTPRSGNLDMSVANCFLWSVLRLGCADCFMGILCGTPFALATCVWEKDRHWHVLEVIDVGIDRGARNRGISFERVPTKRELDATQSVDTMLMEWY